MNNCGNCRYWSDMIAQANPVLEAMCLAPADSHPMARKYTRERHSCGQWKSDHFGKVDSPPDYGAAAQAAYAEEEKTSS